VNEDRRVPLTSLVRAEAARAAAQTRIRPDPSRLEEGWQRRFVVEARRVQEYVGVYETMGFETVVDPVRPEQVEDECGDCRLMLISDFRVIYTRRRPMP
jgi:hypothetical protein